MCVCVFRVVFALLDRNTLNTMNNVVNECCKGEYNFILSSLTPHVLSRVCCVCVCGDVRESSSQLPYSEGGAVLVPSE